MQRLYVIPVQAGWSAATVEQHRDARVVTAQLHNGASLAGQIWATNGAKLTHLEASAGCNSVCFLIHRQAYSILQKLSSTRA
jgi:hypothetical protein